MFYCFSELAKQQNTNWVHNANSNIAENVRYAIQVTNKADKLEMLVLSILNANTLIGHFLC